MLFEMITARKAFEGKTQVSVMAAILEHDPPVLSSITPTSPPSLDRIIRKCLAKDPAERWQSAHDLKDELKWVAETPVAASREESSSTRRFATAGWVAAGLLLLTTIALGIHAYRVAPVAVPSVRFTVQPNRLFSPPEYTEVALSPDGRYLTFVAADTNNRRALWLRPLDGEARLLNGFIPTYVDSSLSASNGFPARSNHVRRLLTGTLDRYRSVPASDIEKFAAPEPPPVKL
jgi:serine/threonine protein kinase